MLTAIRTFLHRQLPSPSSALSSLPHAAATVSRVSDPKHLVGGIRTSVARLYSASSGGWGGGSDGGGKDDAWDTAWGGSDQSRSEGGGGGGGGELIPGLGWREAYSWSTGLTKD